MSSKLVKSIVEPRRLAKFLNWNKKGSSILCLDITDREIGVAVAESASPGTEVHKLNPLSYHKAADAVKNRQQLKETVYDKLNEIVQDNNVGGIVVAWPTVSGGRAGGSCGKVLHLLDYIADHNRSLLSKNRPFTLWDTHNVHKDSDSSSTKNNEVPPDQWGRSVVFSRVPASSSPQGFISSSSDQKFHHTSTKHLSVEKILESFIDSHWANNARRKTTAFNNSQEALLSTQDSDSMESSLL